MSKCIIFEREDGSITVRMPAPKSRREGETEENWLTRLGNRRGPKLQGARLLGVRDEATLPTNRRFRNCWHCHDGEGVSVHMPRARAQRMEEIRAERNRRLAASDGAMARANEIGSPEDVSALKVMRQALRDIPQTVDLEAVVTPEELEAFEPVWPVESVG